MLVPTRIERREKRSMNGPVKGPITEKGISVTARIFVIWAGVSARETSKINADARAIW